MRGYSIDLCLCLLGLYVPVMSSIIKSNAPYNEPQELPDGIIVTEGSTMKAQAAVWTVLVVLDTPLPEVGLREKLWKFKQVISNLSGIHSFSNTIKLVWNERILDLEATMGPSTESRVRRGLLDVVGKVSNKLFGTATEEQVEHCRRKINDVMLINQKIVHTTNELVTIVNQTHDAVRTNQQHIVDIEHFVEKLIIEIERFGKVASSMMGRVMQIEDNAQIDRILTSLEHAHSIWLRQVDLYRRQRAALELGWLTEETLPPADLRHILDCGEDVGLTGPRPEWYYATISVHPMWEEANRLVFRAALPLTADRSYLRYRMHTWPVPHSGEKYTVQLQAPQEVALDTENGEMFVPHSCQGHDPAVCLTGPTYGVGSFLCPRGILTGVPVQRRLCDVTAMRWNTSADLVNEVVDGMFAILTRGTDYTVNCPDQREGYHHLDLGLYLIRIGARCRITSKAWTLRGIQNLNSTLHINLPAIKIEPLQLTELIPVDKLNAHLNKPIWKELPKITDLQIAKIQETPLSTSTEWGALHRGGWGISWTALAGMTVMALGILIYLVPRRRVRIGLKFPFITAQAPHCPKPTLSVNPDTERNTTGVEMTRLFGRTLSGQESGTVAVQDV